MYAQLHALHWTKEYDQEKGLNLGLILEGYEATTCQPIRARLFWCLSGDVCGRPFVDKVTSGYCRDGGAPFSRFVVVICRRFYKRY